MTINLCSSCDLVLQLWSNITVGNMPSIYTVTLALDSHFNCDLIRPNIPRDQRSRTPSLRESTVSIVASSWTSPSFRILCRRPNTRASTTPQGTLSSICSLQTGVRRLGSQITGPVETKIRSGTLLINTYRTAESRHFSVLGLTEN